VDRRNPGYGIPRIKVHGRIPHSQPIKSRRDFIELRIGILQGAVPMDPR